MFKKYYCDICKQKSIKPLTTYIIRIPARMNRGITIHYKVCSDCQKLGEEQIFNLMNFQLEKYLRNNK